MDNATECYAKLNMLDLYKLEIAKLMHQLVNNKLPPKIFFVFTLTKMIHSEQRWHQWNTACIFQDLQLNDYKTVLNIKESKYGT